MLVDSAKSMGRAAWAGIETKEAAMSGKKQTAKTGGSKIEVQKGGC
jgi:hypothetical protein